MVFLAAKEQVIQSEFNAANSPVVVSKSSANMRFARDVKFAVRVTFIPRDWSSGT